MSRTDAVTTGIAALDLILNGGYVENRIHLIEGRPGTGKTTLGIQFLLAGVAAGETVLYVTLSETKDELLAIAASHGLSLDRVNIFELSAVEHAGGDQTLLHPAEVDLTETTEALFKHIDALGPTRIVIDSLSEMRLLAQSALRYRRQILFLKQ
jgi:circadian clock protein KaiC